MPLLIGGATTSRVHTAVKIDPQLRRAARRSMCSTPAARSASSRACCRRSSKAGLQSPASAPNTPRSPRRTPAPKRDKQRLPLPRRPRQRASASTGPATAAPTPSFLGTRTLRRLRSGRARPLHRLDAVLPDLGAERPLSARSSRTRVGRGRAPAVRRRAGDAREDHRREAGSRRAAWSASGRPTPSATTSGSTPTRRAPTSSRRFYTLRQQLAKRDGKPNVALSDFVAPGRQRRADYIGGFAVTAGIEEIAIAERFERANDDYSVDPGQGARRPPRRGLRRAHARARAHASSGAMRRTKPSTPDELIAEHYRGIRPAPGYPAQPDHTEKATLFRLLDAESATGMTADRELSPCGPARRSPASISPTRTAHYFGVGQGRARPGRGLRRAQGHDRSRRSSAGSRRSSTTCRRFPAKRRRDRRHYRRRGGRQRAFRRVRTRVKACVSSSPRARISPPWVPARTSSARALASSPANPARANVAARSRFQPAK